jgi:Pyridoxamine 5'-phosphate oxidase
MAGIPLPDTARQLLESDAVAHVVTLDEDGGPQLTAAWIGIEGDEIVFATLPDQRKLKTSAATHASRFPYRRPERTSGVCSNTSSSTGRRE